jgi:DNA polymerase
MTPPADIGVTRVRSEGPDDATAFFVGEAPGGEEAARGSPFIGRAGDLLIRYLERNRASRNSVYLANLCRYRPPRNKFEALLNTPQLEEGLAELQSEIERVNPNCIIALGSWPLYYLTGLSGKSPGTGILKWRGSRVTSLPRWGSRKVFASMHPSYILRAWGMNPVFNLDIKHALEDAEYPELRRPEYEQHIDPEPDVLYDLVHKAQSAEWISVDIETF